MSSAMHIDYLNCNDYFMSLALLSAKRSKDPSTQVGACIVDNENRIVAIGYNGFPRNCHDDVFPWGKTETGQTDADPLEDKNMYVVHAEANAILNKNSANIWGTRLYSTLFPCNECAKLIIQSGIKDIFFISDKYEEKPSFRASKRMFDAVGVTYTRLMPVPQHVLLDFEQIELEQKNLSLPSSRIRKDSGQLALPLKPIQLDNGTLNYKRQNYLHWADYFMATALLSAKRSKDPIAKVGACIVDNENRIVAAGFNELPRNCHDDVFQFSEDVKLIEDKRMYLVHAEANAILNKNATNIDGMRMFTTLFPCNECAKLIIQSGIGEIFYLSDRYGGTPEYRASRRMFDAAGITYKRFVPAERSILLDFDEIIRNDPSTPMKKMKALSLS